MRLLVNAERPDAAVWLRPLPSPEARLWVKKEFYEGPEWKELKLQAMTLIERWEVVVTRATTDALAR